jgi:hypothetical protein
VAAADSGEASGATGPRRQAPGLQAPVVCRPFLLPLPHQTRAKRHRASASHPLRFARYAFYVPVVVSKIISEILAPLLAALSLALFLVRSAGDKQASATSQIYVCMHTPSAFFSFAFCLRATACETYYFLPCLNGIPTHHTAKEWILSRLWREIIAYFHKQAPLWPQRWLGLATEKSRKNMGSLISQQSIIKSV